MKTLTIQQNLTHSHITKPTPCPKTPQILHQNRRETPFRQPRSWWLHAGPKGFTGTPKETRKNYTPINENNNDDDDKIPEVVWERMIKRILFYVGVPLATGFLLLQVFSVSKVRGLWDPPLWLPFLTTFITFGASALGIAYGSLSTSLDAETEGSFLGFEQVEKNWVEMWKEEDESGGR